jgi:hypothetical protein
MNTRATLVTTIAILAILSACERDDAAEAERAAERAGENVEQGVERAGEATEEGVERAGEAAERVGEEAEAEVDPKTPD